MIQSSNTALLSETVDNSTSQFGPVKLVVIQPTTFCNLNCDYCYLPDRHLKHEFSLELLEPIFKDLFSSPYLKEDFTIVWHSGEPLTMPIRFYESAFETINQLSEQYNHNHYKIYHSIQTNATVINQAWCDFFKQHPVKIGVSLDGPAFLHDKNRKTRTGLGTHASTMRGISWLEKNDIHFNVIAVLTKESLDYPDEIYQFFSENNIKRVGFNVEETEGINQNSSLESTDTDIDVKHYQFMKRFYELTKQPNCKFTVREFERVKRSIMRGADMGRGQSDPYTIISIDHKGDFMTFSPELLSLETPDYGKFVIGNILQDSFESATQTEKFKTITHEIKAGVNACKETCEYFSLCGGGAPANKYFENGSFNSTETLHCRYTQKALVNIVLQDLEESLNLA
ncbi:MAG: cyclophane-forming radical SAM/SPASM peptide maturase GrrM/OscB [Microcoleaceae cyanobacterium]